MKSSSFSQGDSQMIRGKPHPWRYVFLERGCFGLELILIMA